MTLGFVAFSLALAFHQKPGWATSDTKIDLHVDPVRFLSQVASVWTPTTDLGEVHSAQYSGYLWPMGPFFALPHSLGLSAWVVQRLWLALMFALAAWGMLRLLDVLVGRPRGIVHLVATAFYLLNPYSVVFTARTSITLLGYAALPWLLIVVYHGVRAARGWRGWRAWWWAAAFALILTSTGGGVNAAVVGWMLVGPLVLLLYEPATGAVRWRDSIGFLARVGVLGVLASLWWIVPLLVHVQHGIDFLQFTEQPSSIWGTNSITESLRLMGYWTSYIGVGFGINRPFFSDGATLLYNPLVVGASLLLPALAIAGFVGARRRSYAPFLLLLVIVGALIMMAGFPDGTPLRQAMEWVYHNIFVLRFMRTTNKAAPLVAAGIAGLLGLGAQQAWQRLRRLAAGPWRTTALIAAPLALAALIAFAALPLIRGGALDTQLLWKRIPAAWTNAGKDLDRQLPANTRALVLPGQVFGYYNWGGTLDSILPRLTSRPVAVRYETPYSDLRAADLLTTVDDLVQQRRLVPGQLPPLLRLMGVGAVVSGSDDNITRSGALAPAASAAVLAGQGMATPAHSYGPLTAFPPAPLDIGAPVALPEVRRYDVAHGRGIVHIDPTRPAAVIDGSAAGLANLAAFGALSDTAPLFYAGDLSAAALRAQAAHGAGIVVTDSNRRRAFIPQFSTQNVGTTLPVTEAFAANTAVVNPFDNRGTDAQTVALVRGARYLRYPYVAGEQHFPEHRPAAAFDGDVSTSWLADPLVAPAQRWIEVGFNAPRNVPYVDLYPLDDAHAIVTRVDVNGIPARVGRGWTRVRVNLHQVSALRVTIDTVIQPTAGHGGPGGFREIRIPGVHISDLLRAPVLTARALAGTDLTHSDFAYVFERTTGDDPFMRNPYATSTLQDDPHQRGDAERYIDRIVFAPAARTYSADAWVYPAVETPDSALDRLAGLRGAYRFDSSGRFQDQPRYRASSAFDGSPATAWIGLWGGLDAPQPWISWTAPRPLTVTRLRLSPAALPVRRPTLVRLSWSGGSTPPLAVAADGSVVLPRPARARAFRLTVLDARFPASATARDRAARAVGVGELSVPGLPAAAVPRSGPLLTACGDVRIQAGARIVSLRPGGTVARLDAGQPLRARGCAGDVSIGVGAQEMLALPGVFSIDLLRLDSPAPAPLPPAGGGVVVDPGDIGNSSVDGVRVALRGPSWLVLGESFSSGWQAACDGRSLGAPQPIDGYANGWLAPVGCSRVAFSFGPQAGVRASYVISALTCVALLAFLLVGSLLSRGRLARLAPQRLLPDVPTHPLPLWRAVAIAAVVAVPVGAIFALRAGAVSFPLVAFVLWRGYSPRILVTIAAVLLGLVVPLLYMIVGARDQGGYSFAYSTDLISAHWVGVGAILLLAIAVFKTMAAARGARTAPPGPAAGDVLAEPAWESDEHELAGAGANAGR